MDRGRALRPRFSILRGVAALDPRGLPKPLCAVQWIDIELLPPCEFISALVKLTMMKPAERHGEFVTHLATERALLSKPKMMCVRRTATAGQTGLGAHELQMIPVAQPKRFAERGD